jgi:hypothetical protein
MAYWILQANPSTYDVFGALADADSIRTWTVARYRHDIMSVKRRGNSWRARYRGPDRRDRSKSFRRKSDAERWLAQQQSLMVQGDWTDPALGRITFGEYALAWVESRADLKPKTRHQYQWLLRLHLLPAWRKVPLAKVTFEA